MIVFQNRGEIDIEAIRLMGVSVKEGDNPIGMFGTGLKYAIAVLLRTGHKVTIWSGERKLTFTTEKREIRNKPFDVVLMREGDRLTDMAFTTEYGRNWQPWMAYRELYCNARDEGGEVYTATDHASASDPMPGMTQVRVEGSDIEQVHHDASLYFCEDEPDVVVDGIGIYRRPSQVLFYRGIRVMMLPKPAQFTYNLINREISLTEDRTMAHPILATWYLARALAKCGDPEILEGALAPARGALERDFDYGDSSVVPLQAFLDTVSKLKSEGREDVVASAAIVWRRKVPEQFVPAHSTLTTEENRVFIKAMQVCQRHRFDVGNVIVVEATPGAVPTLYEDGTLYLLRERLANGVVETVIDIVRGCMDRDDWPQDKREAELISRLMADDLVAA